MTTLNLISFLALAAIVAAGAIAVHATRREMDGYDGLGDVVDGDDELATADVSLGDVPEEAPAEDAPTEAEDEAGAQANLVGKEAHGIFRDALPSGDEGL